MKKVVFCFDLDSTVTKAEILPSLAREIGLAEEMSILTGLTMDGLIPFEVSFKLRVRLLSTLDKSRTSRVLANLPLSEKIVQFISDNSQKCCILTGNLDYWVHDLITKRIGCRYFSSTALVDKEGLCGVDKFVDKGKVVKDLSEHYDVVVAIGDGSNDLSMVCESDIGISYSGVRKAPAMLIEASDYEATTEEDLYNKLLKINRRFCK